MTTPNVGTEPLAIASNARWTEPAPALPLFERPAWMSHGACVGMDPDLFHPERGDNKRAAEAKAVCRGCEVVEPCLAYALKNRMVGIWAGTSMKERKAMLGRRRGAA